MRRIALMTILTISTFAQDPPAVFRAGFAHVDITPTQAVPLWGYEKELRPNLMSDGILDPLYAKALVIQAGNEKLAIVGLDLGRSPTAPVTAAIKETLAEKGGIKTVLLGASHTHHAPVIELKDIEGQGKGTYDAAIAYVAELQQKVIDAVLQADAKLADARIGWSVSPCTLNRNRHSKIELVPADRDLLVLRVDNAEGKTIATLVNYAAHPTVRPPQDRRFSAEFPGVMMREVQNATGAPCMFIQGAAGDMQCEMDDSLWGVQDFIEPIGKALAAEVVKANESLQTAAPEKPSLVSMEDSFQFKMRVDLKNPLIRDAFSNAYFPELVSASATEIVDSNGMMHPVMTTALLNGNLFLVGVSGEFFCNHAIRLKGRIRGATTLFAGYCNGHHMYFPTIEAAAEGGYGASPEVAWAELGAPEKMMNKALTNFYEMNEK